jgi:hypothetical protein
MTIALDWDKIAGLAGTAIGSLVLLIIAAAIVLNTFPILAGAIWALTVVLDEWILYYPLRGLRWALSRTRFPDEVTYVVQCIVGGILFSYFVFQIENQPTLYMDDSKADHFQIDKRVMFLYLFVLLGTIIILGMRWRARFGPHFAKILFYHRVITPTWRWLAEQSYALLWLERVPILRPVIESMNRISGRIKHRRWRIFLSFMLCLSVFTLPVQLVPWLDYAIVTGLEYFINSAGEAIHS